MASSATAYVRSLVSMTFVSVESADSPAILVLSNSRPTLSQAVSASFSENNVRMPPTTSCVKSGDVTPTGPLDHCDDILIGDWRRKAETRRNGDTAARMGDEAARIMVRFIDGRVVGWRG